MGFLVSLVFTRVVGGAEANGLASCNFPAVYNFGDSNSDTGVCLITVGPTQPPTGRLCDERLIIDFVAEELGISYLSPFALWNQITLTVQILHIQAQLLGPNSPSKPHYAPVIPDKINNFTAAIQSLYDEGGRAFWVHNVGPNGCLPFFQSKINRTQETFDKNGCIHSMNEIVMEFNKQLKDRVIKLRAELPEAFITYVDVYTAKYNLISNAKSLGNNLVPLDY